MTKRKGFGKRGNGGEKRRRVERIIKWERERGAVRRGPVLLLGGKRRGFVVATPKRVRVNEELFVRNIK